MLSDNYHRGYFPAKVGRLRDIVAEDVARAIDMRGGEIHGDPLLYHQAMTDDSLWPSMLDARTRAFSDRPRTREMDVDRWRFRDRMQKQMVLPALHMTPDTLREHRERMQEMLSDEAIEHATDMRYTEEPSSLLRLQTPPERLAYSQIPERLPDEFRNFIRERLGINVGGVYRDLVFHDFDKFNLPFEAYQTLLGQLWKDWKRAAV